ncbi:MAG: glycosyltransferase family 2 protein [Thermoleophilia bacterium]
MTRERPHLAIVVPCYNEEEVLPEAIARLDRLLLDLARDGLTSEAGFCLLVDDGSRDATWRLIEEWCAKSPRMSGLKLARNAGHQKALLAGLEHVAGRVDCAVSVDADLQDDLTAVCEFVSKYREGYDVVFGVRRERATDTRFKRWTAQGFYRLMRLMGVDLVYNHADYRLMSRKALSFLGQFGEVNLFLRGVVTLIGLPTAVVYYDRQERFAGESKYPLKKMLAFALEGITSFSVTPIRWVTGVGFAFCLLSLAAAVYGFVSLAAGVAEPGWTSLILSVWFIGGVQLISLGLLGEYVGKIYQEAKGRPRYFVETAILPTVEPDGSKRHGPEEVAG